MAAIKIELTNELKEIIYPHTSADVVYFNKRLAPGIDHFNVEQALVQLNQRVNDMIILNEDMQGRIDDMWDEVEHVGDVLGERITMFSLTSYIAKDKFESTNGKFPYTQKIVLTGVQETDEVIIGPVQSADYTVAQRQIEAYNCISRIIVNNGSVSMLCYQDVPSINIPIKVVVLRKGE